MRCVRVRRVLDCFLVSAAAACLSWVSVVSPAVSRARAAEPEPPTASIAKTHEAFFKASCLKCHGQASAGAKGGGVRLDDLSYDLTTLATAERWQKVFEMLRADAMPPRSEPRPDETAKTMLVGELSAALSAARKTIVDEGRAAAVRRLNRREYVNTIRDLFGIETQAKGLPEAKAPPAGKRDGWYDTFGEKTELSSDALARYREVARGVVTEAFAALKATESEADEKQTVRVQPEQQHPMRDELAGLMKVVGAHQRRMSDLERWQRTGQNPQFLPEGLPTVDAAKQALEAVRKPSEEYFRAVLRASQPRAFEGWYLHPSPRGENDDGGRFAAQYPRIVLPADLPPGPYVIRVNAAVAGEITGSGPNGTLQHTRAPRLRFIELCSARPKTEPDDANGLRSGPTEIEVVGRHDVSAMVYFYQPPQVITFPITVGPGSPRHYFIREKAHADWRHDIFRTAEEVRANGFGPLPAVWIDWIEWEGPVPRPQLVQQMRKLINPAAPAANPPPPAPKPDVPKIAEPKVSDFTDDDPAVVRAILERFVAVALRGWKPEPSSLDKLVAVQQERRKAGDDFLASLVEPMAMVLASPRFLELNGPAASELALASRLSYFLWSAPPDAPLIAAAQSGALRQGPGIVAQAARMIADPRAAAFAQAFVSQWLELDRLDGMKFDFRLHPTFDEGTRQAAKEEVWQTFQTILKENLDARKLLKSDFVVVNSILGDHYGFPIDEQGRQPLTGMAFRKVAVSEDSVRGGLLGMAGILAIGSDGVSSSPVKRGAWVLRHLLDSPPPPAPANVPPLSRLDGKPLTMRQRLQAHEDQAQCVQCHRTIDPVGFGLENLDAAGLWREFDTLKPGQFVPRNPVTNALLVSADKPLDRLDPLDSKNGVFYPVDPSGTLGDGAAFKNFFQYRELVAARGDAFLRGMIENLYEYALGRPKSFFDAEAIDGLVAAAKADGGLANIVKRIVATPEFRKP